MDFPKIYSEYKSPFDDLDFDPKEYVASLSDGERKKYREHLQSFGYIAPENDGFFGELADAAAQSFIGGLRGFGATANELGLGSGMQEYFDDVLNTNRQWDRPDELGVAGYIGRGIGSGVGSTGVLLPAIAADAVLPTKGAITAAAAFAMTFGDNVQRNRRAYGDGAKAYLLAAGESSIDAAIEVFLGNVPALGKSLKGLTGAGKRALVDGVMREGAKELGKNGVKQFFWNIAKNGLEEGSEEALQYVNSWIWRAIGGDPENEFNTKELLDNAAMGVIGGIGIGGVTESITSLSRRGTVDARTGNQALRNDTQGAPASWQHHFKVSENQTAAEVYKETIPGMQVVAPTSSAAKVMDAVAREVGLDPVYFVDPEGEYNGFYNDGNRVYINANQLAKNPMWAMGHEFREMLGKNAPDLAQAWDDTVAQFTRRNSAVTGRKAQINEQYTEEEAASQGLTKEQLVNKEFSADRMGDMFVDPDFWEAYLSRVSGKNRTLGQKVIDYLNRLIRAVKKQIIKIKSPDAARFLKRIEEVRNRAVDIVAQYAQRSAGENATQTNVETAAQTASDAQQTGQAEKQTERSAQNTAKEKRVESVPTDSILLDPKRFQHRENFNKSGVDANRQLSGEWTPEAAGNVYLWEDKSGNRYIVNGHHRLDLARRNGVKTLNAFIDREVDGVTPEMARDKGTELNILDDKATVREYADFFRKKKMSVEEAKRKGFYDTNNRHAQAGFEIGRYASDNLYAAYRNGDLTDSQAAAIADIARGDEAIEAAGIRKVKEGKLKAGELREFLKILKQIPRKENSDTGDFFGFDDSALQTAEMLGKAANEKIRSLREQERAAKNAIKNPDAAKKLKVTVGKGAERLLQNIQKQIQAWEHYETNPELMNELRRAAGIEEITPAVAEQTKEADNSQAKSEAPAEPKRQTEQGKQSESGGQTVPQKEETAKATKTATADDALNNLSDDEWREWLPEIKKKIEVFQKNNANAGIDEGDLYEAAQRALAKAKATYTGEKSAFKTWGKNAIDFAFKTVLRNKAIELKRTSPTPIDATVEGTDGATIGDTVADERAKQPGDDLQAKRDWIDSFANTLNDQQKKVLKLLDEEKSTGEIAKALGVSPGRVSQIRRDITSRAVEYQKVNRASKESNPNQINPIVEDGKVKAEYQELLEEKGVTPEKVAEWDKKAVEWITRLGGVEKAFDAIMDDQVHPDSHVDTLIRRHILNSDFFATLDQEDQIDFSGKYIDNGTNWGREGVARRIASLTMDSVAKVRALFEKLAEKMPDRDYVKMRNDIIDATGVDINSLPQDIVENKEKLDAVLRETLAHRANFWDKAYEFWINSILSTPQTHVANLIGNTANAVYELGIRRLAEAAVNVVLRRKNAATFGEFKAMLHAFDWKKALQKAAEAFNIETLDRNGKIDHTGIAIGGKTGRGIRVPGRLLKASDEFAKILLQPVEATAYAYREATIQGLTGKAREDYIAEQLANKNSAANLWGNDRVKELTFQEDPGDAVKKLIALKESGGATGLFLKFLLPFVKTPHNILRQGVRKSNLGIFSLAWETGEALLGKRKFDSKYVEHVAEQLIIWGITAAMLSSDDDDDLPSITGAAPAYGSAEQQFKGDKIPPYSIRIGGKYYSYQRIEPFSTMLATLADGVKAFKDAKNGVDGTKIMKNIFNSGFQIIAEKSYLDSLNTLNQFARDPEHNAMRFITNFAASWMPNIVSRTIGMFDDMARDNKIRSKGEEWWNDQFQSITNRMGLTKAAPKVDYFGREITKDALSDAGPLGIIGRLVPIRAVDPDKNMDRIDRMFWEYNQRHPDAEYWPSIPSYTFEHKGKRYYFSGDNYHDYAVESGKLAHRQIENAIRHGLINPRNPKEKDIKLVKQIFTRARKEVREKMIKQKRYSK